MVRQNHTYTLVDTENNLSESSLNISSKQEYMPAKIGQGGKKRVW